MPTKYQDTAHADLYKHHALDNQYEMVPGTFALPVADEAPEDATELADWSPVVVVQAHAPYRIRRVAWATRKSGAPPVIPSPETTGAFTFVGGAIHFDYPRFDALGSGFLWSIKGEYAFVETVRSDVSDGWILGSEPVPSQVNQQLLTTYGGGTAPEIGAVSQAGVEVKMAYAESLGLSLTSADYTFWSPTFFPGALANDGMLNGDVQNTGVTP